MTTKNTKAQSPVGHQPLYGPASLVKITPQSEGSASDGLQLNGAEPRDDLAPLPNGRWRDPERPGDIRWALKVIDNVLFQHTPPFTRVKSALQPEFQAAGLTLVHMDRYATMTDRLNAAIEDAGVIPSDLARACSVSPAAVHKWQNGGKLSADSLAAAARALGVREEWLRTGRLPKDRETAEEDRDIDQVVSVLADLREPLAALVSAIERLEKIRPEAAKKRVAKRG